MTLSDAMKRRILELCDCEDEGRGITINKLCTISGVTQSTLSEFYNEDNRVLKVQTILQLCNGLGIKLKDFFDSELFIDLDEEN